jgi:hypothetical protein
MAVGVRMHPSPSSIYSSHLRALYLELRQGPVPFDPGSRKPFQKIQKTAQCSLGVSIGGSREARSLVSKVSKESYPPWHRIALSLLLLLRLWTGERRAAVLLTTSFWRACMHIFSTRTAIAMAVVMLCYAMLCYTTPAQPASIRAY